MTTARTAPWPGVIEAYRSRMPVQDGWKIVTLGEGGTPLLPAPHLSERTGCEVLLKVDGANPTGSFKDRGMTVAVSRAKGRGAEARAGKALALVGPSSARSATCLSSASDTGMSFQPLCVRAVRNS